MTLTVMVYALAGWLVLSIGVGLVFGRILAAVAREGHQWDAWLDLRIPHRGPRPLTRRHGPRR